MAVRGDDCSRVWRHVPPGLEHVPHKTRLGVHQRQWRQAPHTRHEGVWSRRDLVCGNHRNFRATPAAHGASNSFNGMLLDVGHGGTGIGAVRGQLCYVGTQRFGRFDGNTFHSHGRFGTYGLGSLFPKKTISQSVASNGVTKTTSQCSSFTSDGYDNGWPGTFNNNFDYYNTFVGHYGAGDVQYRKHASIENLNLIYWKDSKSFADGCSALLKDGFYRKGNLALPDEGAFLLENLVLSDGAGLEANHHCHVGVPDRCACRHTFL